MFHKNFVLKSLKFQFNITSKGCL